MSLKKISEPRNNRLNNQEPQETKNQPLRGLSPSGQRPPSPQRANNKEPLSQNEPGPSFEPKNITRLDKTDIDYKELESYLEETELSLAKSKKAPTSSGFAKNNINADLLEFGICVTDPKKLMPQPETFEDGIRRIRIFRKWHKKSALCNALNGELRDAKPKERRELVQKIQRLKKELYNMEWQDLKSKNEDTYFTNRDRQGRPLLPIDKAYYYKEYVFGETPEDLQRFVVGEAGEVYYTPDHYDIFYFFGLLQTPEHKNETKERK